MVRYYTGESDSECRVNALRLIQSVLFDNDTTAPALIHEAREVVSSFHHCLITAGDLLKRLFKFGYSSNLISFSDLIKSCSEDLFENAHKSNHCLHELFSSYLHRLESLRPRGHDECCQPVLVIYTNSHLLLGPYLNFF